MNCKHSKAWILCGGHFLWCPDCGSIRRGIPVEGNSSVPIWKHWIKPGGQLKALEAIHREEHRIANMKISLCSNCLAMTKTFSDYCGKCGKKKQK